MDCERFLMVKALSPLIEAGRIKLYAVDSVCRRSWADSSATPRHKAFLQAQYDKYMVEELLPWIREDCGGTTQRFAACGASLGGYNALNSAAKHPEWFDRMVGMSGTYVLDRRMNGYWDENYYFNMPVQFLPRLEEGPQLRGLRDSLFILAIGSGPHDGPHYIEQVAPVLRQKGIPHRVEVWGRDADHDWPTWRTMLPLFLDKII